MSQFARVTSLDALQNFKAALIEFAGEANLALSEATSDVQRTTWWIQNDRYQHWQREIKKRTEKLAQAKAELFKKQLESNDTRTSAIVERKNVAKAQAALDEAEDKLRRVKKWSLALDREIMLFRAGLGQVSGAVSGDLPAAIGRMDKMINSLEAYLKVAAPASSPVTERPPAQDAGEIRSETSVDSGTQRPAAVEQDGKP
jgi:hypothetical protein